MARLRARLRLGCRVDLVKRVRLGVDLVKRVRLGVDLGSLE